MYIEHWHCVVCDFHQPKTGNELDEWLKEFKLFTCARCKAPMIDDFHPSIEDVIALEEYC